MALGSIKTPLILQQSGVGPADVLSAAGVTQRVDLPVGLNLIDQTTTTTDWSFSGNRGGGQPITFPRFQDMFDGSDASNLRSMLQNDLASYVQDAVSSGSASSASAPGLQKVLEIQRDWILNKNVAFSENFDYTYDSTLGYDSWYLLPFGRGSIKIRDNNAYGTNYAINPRYFSNPFDRLAQGGSARYTRKVSEGSPLNQYAGNESVPGKGAVSSGASLEQWAAWAEDNYRSNWHPIGTAAMMSRDLGGSVDSNNKLVSALHLGQMIGADHSVRRRGTSCGRRLPPPLPGVLAPHVSHVRSRRACQRHHQSCAPLWRSYFLFIGSYLNLIVFVFVDIVNRTTYSYWRPSTSRSFPIEMSRCR